MLLSASVSSGLQQPLTAHTTHLLAEFLLGLNLFFFIIILILFLTTLEATDGIHGDEVVLIWAACLLFKCLQLPEECMRGLGWLWAT